MTLTRALAITAVALAALGCGARHGAAGDAGAPDAGDAAPARRSFDVVATMATIADASVELRMTTPFTLVLDFAAMRAIGGAGGQARVVRLTTADGGTFHVSPSIVIGFPSSACSGLQRIEFDGMDITVTGDQLSGTAVGRAFLAGEDAAPKRVEATLMGGPDTTPPFLMLPEDVTTNDPVASFQVWASEPLPPTALARLVGGDGAVAGLDSEIIDGDVPLIASFGSPALTLPPDQTFTAMFSDDVVDLAGNPAPLGDSVRLGSVIPAPLVAADGFESATTDTLGGASVVGGQAGIAINGAKCVYIGNPMTAPLMGDVKHGPRLVVRMTVPPGATKLAFSYRELAFGNHDDVGSVQLGSVGRPPGPATQIPAQTTFEIVTQGVQNIEVSPVATMQVPLPDERGPEVVVVIRTGHIPCTNPGFGTPGVLIDDLRLE